MVATETDSTLEEAAGVAGVVGDLEALRMAAMVEIRRFPLVHTCPVNE